MAGGSETLVSRFRSSQALPARSHANFGIKRDTSKYIILVRFLDLKFLCEFPTELQELQIHRTGVNLQPTPSAPEVLIVPALRIHVAAVHGDGLPGNKIAVRARQK